MSTAHTPTVAALLDELELLAREECRSELALAVLFLRSGDTAEPERWWVAAADDLADAVKESARTWIADVTVASLLTRVFEQLNELQNELRGGGPSDKVRGATVPVAATPADTFRAERAQLLADLSAFANERDGGRILNLPLFVERVAQLGGSPSPDPLRALENPAQTWGGLASGLLDLLNDALESDEDGFPTHDRGASLAPLVAQLLMRVCEQVAAAQTALFVNGGAR